MTLLPSKLAQSILAEKCSFYLDSVSDNLPASLHILHDHFASVLKTSAKSPSPQIRALARHFGLDHLLQTYPVTLLLFTVIVCVIIPAGVVVVVMSSWRSPFGSIFRRSAAPQVSERDYSYVTPDEVYDAHARPSSRRAHGEQKYPETTLGSDPDILLLKHRGATYPLHFSAFAIEDGKLCVGHLRQRAAEAMGSSDPDCIKLLYKGRLLKDNSRSCRAEGLKQQSELLCVVSEVQTQGSVVGNDVSEVEPERLDNDVAGGPHELNSPSGTETSIPVTTTSNSTSTSTSDVSSKAKKKKNNNKKSNNKKNKDKLSRPEMTATGTNQPSLPTSLPSASTGTGSTSTSSLPSPAPNLKDFGSPLEQLNALHSYFRSELFPLYEQYITNPPSSMKAREYEYRKINETIMAQVILKADGVDTVGYPDARNARRALITEAQTCQYNLDKIPRE